MLVKSFMSELTELASIVEKTSTEVIQDSMRSQDLSRSLDTSLESAERCEATAAAANRPLRPLSDSSKPRKRLRLEEMRVEAQLDEIGFRLPIFGGRQRRPSLPCRREPVH